MKVKPMGMLLMMPAGWLNRLRGAAVSVKINWRETGWYVTLCL